jgi:hypothetical protein
MLVREVHLSSKQFKEACRADINTDSSVTPYALLTVEPDMWRFIDFKAYKLQTLLYWLHCIASLLM